MKRLVVVVIAVILLASVGWAGELDELKLKKELIETQLANLQMQVQLIQQTFSAKQTELNVVNDKIRLLEPKKEEPKKPEKK